FRHAGSLGFRHQDVALICERLKRRGSLLRPHGRTVSVTAFAGTLRAIPGSRTRPMCSTRGAAVRLLGILLIAIASVSLVVGGISIMNIMLVSVTERTREIGLRMAVGASRSDIRWQFLIEALNLALLGGSAGAMLGMACAIAIAWQAGWPVLISPWVV